MSTITSNMTDIAKMLLNEHRDEIDALPQRGPKGGTNAANIPGWSHSPHQTITKACMAAGVPVLNYWHGSAPTPASAIPSCIAGQLLAAYYKITEATK